MTMDIERLAKIKSLKSALSPSDDDAVKTLLEAAAWITHDPNHENPSSVCSIIACFLGSWDKAMLDGERTELLLPLAPQIIGTAGDQELKERRCLMCADWLVRSYAPAWLQLAGLFEEADELAALPEIDSFLLSRQTATAISTVLNITLHLRAEVRAQATRLDRTDRCLASNVAGAATRRSAGEASLHTARRIFELGVKRISDAYEIANVAAEVVTFEAADRAIAETQNPGLGVLLTATERALEERMKSLQKSALELVGGLIELSLAATYTKPNAHS